MNLTGTRVPIEEVPGASVPGKRGHCPRLRRAPESNLSDFRSCVLFVA